MYVVLQLPLPSQRMEVKRLFAHVIGTQTAPAA
jgi:hypothetical protein